MTIILCAINDETGEVLNRDGSVAGKVVPPKCSQEAFESAVRYAVDADEPAKKFWPQIYAAMLAASRVDLSGCGVKVPEQKSVSRYDTAPRENAAYNAAIQFILYQMPQVKK